MIARVFSAALIAMWIFVSVSATAMAAETEPAETEANETEATGSAESQTDPLKILLITGGCCHDYDFQAKAMQLAFDQRDVKAVWTVVFEGGDARDAQIDFYDDPNWAVGFDVVIHNACFANTADSNYIRKITTPHRAGTNAVVIHCAMHTYRNAKIDDWRELLGVTSRRHEHQSHYPITVVAADHPAMQDYPADHVSAIDELYVIEKLWPTATALATSKSELDGKSYPVIWVNQFGSARVFGTTFGHSSETFQDKVFLNSLVNGTKWAAGR